MPTSPVYCVKLCASDSDGPNKNSSTFTEATLPEDHPIFTQFTSSPISLKLDYPLVIWRLNTRTIGTTNPRVTWLMIAEESLLALMVWQDNVGDVVVARADKKPLFVKSLTAFTDYIWDILQTSDPVYEEEVDENYDPRRYYKPEKLKEYMDNYPKLRDPDIDYYS